MANVTVIDIGGTIAAHRRGFIALGAALMVAGALSIIFPLAGGLALELWLAVTLVVAGTAQAVHAFSARQWDGFLLGLLVGVLYLAAGIVLWLYPLTGIVTLTVFLAAAIFLDGLLRAALAFQVRPLDGWLVLLVGGLLGIVVAVLLWLQLPSSAAWALGLLLGINLMFSGFAFIMFARAARPMVGDGNLRV